MSRILKKVLNHTYRPLLQEYLKKERQYHYGKIHLKVFPGVFHPGFFYSSKILAGFLKDLPLKNKTLLDLGAGTGLIALFAAKKGAIVTASDISTKAIDNILANQRANDIRFPAIHSDLFTSVPLQVFHYILINPPYYKSAARSESDHAWYAGENYEYFQRLFPAMKSYCDKQTEVIMVLSEDCDTSTIFSIAGGCGFVVMRLSVHNRLAEKLVLYKLRMK